MPLWIQILLAIISPTITIILFKLKDIKDKKDDLIGRITKIEQEQGKRELILKVLDEYSGDLLLDGLKNRSKK